MSGRGFYSFVLGPIACLSLINPCAANEYILQRLKIVNDPLNVNHELENIHKLYPNISNQNSCNVNSSSAQSLISLSRKELANVTLCFKPEIQQVYLNYKAALSRLGQAKGVRLPEIDWQTNANERRLDKFVIDSERPELDVPSRVEKTIREGFNFTWKVTNFGATTALIDRTELQAKSAAYDLVASANNNILEAILTQEDLKGSLQVLKFYNEARETSQENVEIAIERQRLGVGSRSDVINSQTIYNRTEIDILQISNEITQKYIILLNTLGIAKNVNKDIDIHEVQPAIQSLLNVNSDIDKSLLLELTNNMPERLSAINAHQATLKRVQELEKENNPSILLSTSKGEYKNKIRGGSYYNSNETNISLTLKVPLFSGFINTYKVKESLQQAAAQELQLNIIETKIQKETANNLKQLQSELLIKKKLENYIELSELNYEAMKEKYLRGVADISFMLNASRELINAKVELARCISRLVISQIKHLYFQGKMNEIY
jgi:outer membrane protein